MREILGTFVVALCFTGILSAAVAADAPTVSVEHLNLTHVKGDAFFVNITVDPEGVEVFGVQYTLSFDPAILQVVNQTKGGFLSQDGNDSMDIANTFDNILGVLEYGEMRLGAELSGVTAPGTLARIRFNLTNCGSSILNLSNVVMANSSAQPIFGVKTKNATVHGFIRGDLAPYPDGNCVVDIGDVIRLLNYIHDPAKYPVNEVLADTDQDDRNDMEDVVFLLEYVGEE